MREQIVVGAGLSGLVAAINLAREGRSVLVRERRDRIGGATGMPGFEDIVINIGDGTPMHLDRVRSYIGIDLGDVAVPLKKLRNHIYGKTFDIDFYPGVPTYLFERGPTPSSLDTYLYETARSEGVEFSFDDTVEDFGDLPPGTIIATGLFGEAWPVLRMSDKRAFGHFTMSRTDDESAKVIVYFDEYTRDYAFYSQVNGACGACLFSREKPLEPSVKERFERQLSHNDGLSFDEWHSISIGALPVLSVKRPRLFAGDYILAGSLSGSVDPLLLFGVHGALVTGKIAALAVSDRERALEEFRRVNRRYVLGLCAATALQHTPLPLVRVLTRAGARSYPVVAPILKDRLWTLVPGFRSI
jgi:flavin-dependent dehydrogenase